MSSPLSFVFSKCASLAKNLLFKLVEPTCKFWLTWFREWPQEQFHQQTHDSNNLSQGHDTSFIGTDIQKETLAHSLYKTVRLVWIMQFNT